MWIKKPYDGDFKITSPFGYRIHPITGKRKLHTGIDIGLPKGTEVFSPVGGQVIVSKEQKDEHGKSTGYGKYIAIYHKTDRGTHCQFRFAHLSKLLVKTSQYIVAGQLIGLSGNSGGSTGAHLHYEIRIQNEKGFIPQDPKQYTDFA